MGQKIVIPNLGPRTVQSPLRLHSHGSVESTFVHDDMYYRDPLGVGPSLEASVQLFERAGPREKLHFEPFKTKVAIVTCGGLCPGLNNVIRSVYVQLHYHYGVPAVLGVCYGFSGFSAEASRPPMWLNSEIVNNIHQLGGTLLGTSRGPVSADIIVDFLEQRGINVLFTVGGDGTQRGAHSVVEEIRSEARCWVLRAGPSAPTSLSIFWSSAASMSCSRSAATGRNAVPTVWLRKSDRRHAAGYFARARQRRHHCRFSGAARHQCPVHGRRRRDATRCPQCG